MKPRHKLKLKNIAARHQARATRKAQLIKLFKKHGLEQQLWQAETALRFFVRAFARYAIENLATQIVNGTSNRQPAGLLS